jgi:hypothetical protein
VRDPVPTQVATIRAAYGLVPRTIEHAADG